MPKFRVVAERYVGVKKSGLQVNPFLIRDIFNPALNHTVEQRVWEDMECSDEAEVRAFFEQGQKNGLVQVAGFNLVSVKRVDEPASGRCTLGEKQCVCGGDLPSVRACCDNWEP